MEGRDGSPCFFVALSCAAVGHEIGLHSIQFLPAEAGVYENISCAGI